MMIFYPKFRSYTPMFSIPGKIDEFRVICFIFATFVKSFSVVYLCFHCESVWLTFSVYGSISQRRKHNNVSTCCYFQFLLYVDVSIASPCDSLSQFTFHFRNDANIIKYFQKVWHEMKGIFLPILPLCSPIFRHSQLSNQSQIKYFWKDIQIQVAKLQPSCCSNLRNIYSYI